MARSGSVALDQEPLLAAAVIAGQATLGAEGFRQRDVRFFLELFSNWLQSTTGNWTLLVHNTQIQRALELQTRAGWSKRVGRRPPRYRLTPEGLLELLRRLVQRKDLTRLDEFFLVYHILDAYGARIRELVAHSGLLSAHRLLVDFDELVDPSKFVARERALLAREMARLEARSSESQQMNALAEELLQRGQPLAEVVLAVEKRFPYELNSQKPLRELLEQLPTPWRRVEMTEATLRRARGLWEPTRQLLKAYDAILADLVSGPRPEPAPHV